MALPTYFRKATRQLSPPIDGAVNVFARSISFSNRNQHATPFDSEPRARSYDSSFRRQTGQLVYESRTASDEVSVKSAKSAKSAKSQATQPKVLKVKPASPSFDRSALNFMIDGKERQLASLALRDLCSCPRCIDSSTKQKMFYTPDIPADIIAKDPVYGPETISVKWFNDVPGYGEDHITEIPLKTLRKLVTSGRTVAEYVPPRRTLWDSKAYSQQTKDYDYETYMQDDTALYSAVRQLQTHGLLFVKNVPKDEDSVVSIAERIGPLKTTFYGKTWDVRSVPQAKNVAYTSQNLGFHMDLMYMKQPPHLQLLHCIQSSSSGGASLFCDSFKAADDLANNDLASFVTLAGLRTEFHYDHPDNYYHQSRSVMEESHVNWGGYQIRTWTRALAMQRTYPENRFLQNLTLMDFLEHVAWSPPFQAPFKLDGDPSADPDRKPTEESTLDMYSWKVWNWHNAARKFNGLIHKPDVIYERLMKPGECVIFDNRRVLHARRAFELDDVGKERWLRGAYIDKDPYMSKMKILADRFTSGSTKTADIEQSCWDDEGDDGKVAAAS